ncbi:TetR family transcriptional regulator [Brevibacterium atlanticum]|uniref:TetR family transcriptional regulator n=1 Tax=Brevibacterium atlanticum TaxID=2697563 RepID=UPI003898E225
MPRVSRAQAQAHRDQMIEIASELLCTGGAEAMTVAAVTGGAGLTTGGFYKQFSSRASLLVEAARFAIARRRAALVHDGTDKVQTTHHSFVDSYLSPAHRDDRAAGCPVSALAERRRRSPPRIRTRCSRSL